MKSCHLKYKYFDFLFLFFLCEHSPSFRNKNVIRVNKEWKAVYSLLELQLKMAGGTHHFRFWGLNPDPLTEYS